jgi:hypothetical protein
METNHDPANGKARHISKNHSGVILRRQKRYGGGVARILRRRAYGRQGMPASWRAHSREWSGWSDGWLGESVLCSLVLFSRQAAREPFHEALDTAQSFNRMLVPHRLIEVVPFDLIHYFPKGLERVLYALARGL